MRRVSAAIVLIVGVAAPVAAALAVAAPPPATEGPIACVFQQVPGADIVAAIQLGARDGKNATPAESAAKARVVDVMRNCASRYHWSKERGAAAFFYAGGRASLEDSQQKLRGYGIDPAFVERFAATLTAPQRAATLKGEFDFGPSVYQALADSGFRMKNDSESEWEKLGEVIGEGLAGVILRDQGLADFGASGS
jgi:hypothetical protein